MIDAFINTSKIFIQPYTMTNSTHTHNKNQFLYLILSFYIPGPLSNAIAMDPSKHFWSDIYKYISLCHQWSDNPWQALIYFVVSKSLLKNKLKESDFDPVHPRSKIQPIVKELFAPIQKRSYYIIIRSKSLPPSVRY